MTGKLRVPCSATRDVTDGNTLFHCSVKCSRHRPDPAVSERVRDFCVLCSADLRVAQTTTWVVSRHDKYVNCELRLLRVNILTPSICSVFGLGAGLGGPLGGWVNDTLGW